MSEDDPLLERLRDAPRDERLWTDLYERLYPLVYILTFRLSDGDGDLAEEVTQDAFVRFIRSGGISKVASVDAATDYIRAIVRNLMRNRFRQRMQHPTVSTEEIKERELELAFERSIRKTLADSDLLVIAGLLEADRDLLRRVMEGRSISEVAEQMGLSYSAAAVRIHRLRKHLRRYL